MKKRIFQIACLAGLFHSADAQVQQIIPFLVSSAPAVNTADTSLIELCAGDTLWVAGAGYYPENGQQYVQTDATSAFEWSFNEGALQYGQTAFHVYEKPGLYSLNLKITDAEGYSNEFQFLKRILVKGIFPTVVTTYPEKTCPGNSISLFAKVDSVQYESNKWSFIPEQSVRIPNGTGEVLTIPFSVQGVPGEILESENDVKICAKILHTWGYDLDIFLTDPLGNQIKLQDQEFIGKQMLLGVPDYGPYTLPVTGESYWYCWENSADFTLTEYDQFYMPFNMPIPQGSYRPFQSFGAFIGTPVTGTWEFEIMDWWGMYNGLVDEVYLQIGQQTVYSLFPKDFGWEPDSTIFSGAGTQTAQAVPTPETTLNFGITDSSGCQTETSVSDLILSPSDSSHYCQPCSDFQFTLIADSIVRYCYNGISISPHGPIRSNYEYTWKHNNEILRTAGVGAKEAGWYSLEIYNPFSGCIFLDSIFIPKVEFPLPAIDAGPDIFLGCDLSPVQLSLNDSLNLYPYNAQWQNNNHNLEDTTLVGLGSYILRVTNRSNYCTSWDTLLILPPISISEIEVTPASCGQADGAASIIALFDPSLSDSLTYTWSNGETGPVAENLAKGWYSVTMTLSGQCQVEKQFFIDESLNCKVRLSGKVRSGDSGLDCFEFPATEPLGGAMLHLLPADIYTYSNSDGNYEFITEPGEFTVEVIENLQFNPICPEEGNYVVGLNELGTSTTDLDFYVHRNLLGHNFSVAGKSTSAGPGQNVAFQLTVCNLGDTAADLQLVFIHDPLFADYDLSAIATTYDPNTSTATWQWPMVEPGDCRTVDFRLFFLDWGSNGPKFHHLVKALPIDGDFNPADNIFEWNQPLIYSYDPNNKQVSPADDESGGLLNPGDSLLYYRIQFQNIGNDTAFTVVVRDTLDDNLDVTSIIPGVASHPYRLQFEGRNVLVFFFDNIHLPDSTANPEASQGFVTFSIALKPGLEPETEIRNSAAIYFDFNAPVITNTVVSTIAGPDAVEDISNPETEATLHPNPTAGSVRLTLNHPLTAEANLRIFTVTGALMRQTTLPVGTRQSDLDLSGFPAGLYWIQLVGNTTTLWTGKVVRG